MNCLENAVTGLTQSIMSYLAFSAPENEKSCSLSFLCDFEYH
ncbi:unnamed protein product [Brugia timori]|uniref:Uncharacterized protein n=1 Tax=Brugia timori TaxID=42155 RepID=A0A0R3R5T8_9BILA|nr:unnamed protein product [Brugia timori]